MTQASRPDRALVLAVSNEEASAVGLSIDQFLHSSSIIATEARRRAYRRIKTVTGCSNNGLATVFGCDRGAVLDALRPPQVQHRKPATSGFRDTAFPRHDLGAALRCFAAIERIQNNGFVA